MFISVKNSMNKNFKDFFKICSQKNPCNFLLDWVTLQSIYRLKTYALSGGAIRISVEDWLSSCSAPFPGLESPFSGCGAGGKGRSLRRRSDIFTNFLFFLWFSWINIGYGIKIPEWKIWIISLKLVTFTIFFCSLSVSPWVLPLFGVSGWLLGVSVKGRRKLEKSRLT